MHALDTESKSQIYLVVYVAADVKVKVSYPTSVIVFSCVCVGTSVVNVFVVRVKLKVFTHHCSYYQVLQRQVLFIPVVLHVVHLVGRGVVEAVDSLQYLVEVTALLEVEREIHT